MAEFSAYEDAGALLSTDLFGVSRAPFGPDTFFNTNPNSVATFVGNLNLENLASFQTARSNLVLSEGFDFISGVSVSLSNPLGNIAVSMTFKATAGGVTWTFPTMSVNDANSSDPGTVFFIEADPTGTHNFTLNNPDGSALISSMAPGQFAIASLLFKNTTVNGGLTLFFYSGNFLLAANNLSDVASASTSRTNLGLGSIATQNANNVAITGGTINGTVIGGATPENGSFTDLTATNTQITNPGSIPQTVLIAGSNTGVDGSLNQYHFNITGTFAPVGGATSSNAFAIQPQFKIPTGQTVDVAACVWASPHFPSSNLGTISDAIGYYYDGGTTLGAGTLGAQYGAYILNPLAGTVKVAVYADNMAIGTTGVAPPSGGLLISGNIKNTALSASSVVTTDSSKNLTTSSVLSPALGGTGLSSPTADSLLVSNGSSAMTLLGTVTSNQLLLTQQSCFVAYLAFSQSNVTGDGTNYKIPFANIDYDQNSDFNTTTNVYTAPVTAKMLFGGVTTLVGTTISNSYSNRLVATGVTVVVASDATSSSAPSIPWTQRIMMTIGDTAEFHTIVSGGTKVVEVYGDGQLSTTFSGTIEA